MNVYDNWLKSPKRREFAQVVFEPAGCSPKNYNLWTGFSVTPQAGECSLYLDHIRENICNNDEKLFDYVIAWMAHTVQKPGELPGTALVLRGRQGTGKSLFAHIFGALAYAHYLHLSSQRHLLGNFNAHTKNKLIMYADEAFWAGDKAAEGTLKALITEPTRMIEYKGRDALSVNNFTRLIMSSNHDWVVPAGFEERRFVVIDVSAKHMQDTEYFGRMTAQMGKRGSAALLHYLMNVDISSVNLRVIPKTTALLETKLLTMSTVDRFWYERLVDGCNVGGAGTWAMEVRCADMHHAFAQFAELSGERRRAGETELGRALRRLIPGLSDVRRRPHGTKQERNWVFPSLDACRDAFCEALGQPVDWDGQDGIATSPKRGGRK